MAYKLEQEWKDPKKRRRNVVVGLILALVICYGYYNCWFGGPKPVVYNLNWCPDSCRITGGFASGGTPSGGGACGTCPDGGSCECPEQSCDTCTPPAGKLPCGLNGDYMCGGYCPQYYACEYFTQGECACVPQVENRVPDEPECGWQAYNSLPLALVGGYGMGYCGGTCPSGQTCLQYFDLCQCYPTQDTCYTAGGRTCGGGCSNPAESCVYDAKYESCQCEGQVIL